MSVCLSSPAIQCFVSVLFCVVGFFLARPRSAGALRGFKLMFFLGLFYWFLHFFFFLFLITIRFCVYVSLLRSSFNHWHFADLFFLDPPAGQRTRPFSSMLLIGCLPVTVAYLQQSVISCIYDVPFALHVSGIDAQSGARYRVLPYKVIRRSHLGTWAAGHDISWKPARVAHIALRCALRNNDLRTRSWHCYSIFLSWSVGFHAHT